MTVNRLVLNRSIAKGLDIIGDRWTLLILRDVFLGRTRFEQLRLHTGAGRATLTRRLAALVVNGVLFKKPYSNAATRFEYRLTEQGANLYGGSLLAWQWELEWLVSQSSVSGEAPPLPPRLHHDLCAQALHPQAVCRSCQQALQLGDVRWSQPVSQQTQQLSDAQSLNQRRLRSRSHSKAADNTLEHIADLVGDRWSVMILLTAFFGLKRFDDFAKQLFIASNILTERLNSLITAGVFERVTYQDNPPRSEYLLTTKGKSLYPFIMALRQWVLDCLPEPDLDSELIHKNCNKVLVVDVNCRACGQKPWLNDVSYGRQKP